MPRSHWSWALRTGSRAAAISFVARVDDRLDGRLGIDPAAHAHVGGQRAGVDAEELLLAAAFVVDQVVGHGHGPLEPAGHGLVLLFPLAPGDVVGGAEMGVDQHFLGRHAESPDADRTTSGSAS